MVVATGIGYVQASNLAHLLMNSLPFKEMWFPAASLYASAAQTIVWLGPISAATSSFILASRRTIRIAAIAGSAAAPLVSWLIVAARTGFVVPPAGYVNEAPDFSRVGALQGFGFYCAVAMLFGVVLALPTVFFLGRKRTDPGPRVGLRRAEAADR
jgi:hypothetical protein